jgi:hypothetical protein
MDDTRVWQLQTRDPEASSGPDEMLPDVTGYDVEALDGSVGKIDEASFEVAAGYLVVDTGWWIFGKKRIVPVGVVTDIDDQHRQVFVRCSKDELRAAPDYEPDKLSSADPMYRSAVGDYYGRF